MMKKGLTKKNTRLLGWPGNLSGELSPDLRGELSPHLFGELSADLRGELSPYLRGELSPKLCGKLSPYLYGELSPGLSGVLSPDLYGDVTGVFGCVTGAEGNLDDCGLTAEDRARGVDIQELIAGQ